jgi:hypothetical protein
MNISTRFAAVCAFFLFGLCAGARAEIKTGDNPEASPIWQKVRASLFQSRPIATATDDVISLEAPVRADLRFESALKYRRPD